MMMIAFITFNSSFVPLIKGDDDDDCFYYYEYWFSTLD